MEILVEAWRITKASLSKTLQLNSVVANEVLLNKDAQMTGATWPNAGGTTGFEPDGGKRSRQ